MPQLSFLFFFLVFFLTPECILGQGPVAIKIDSLLKLLNKTEEVLSQQQINLKLAEIITNGYQSIKYAERSLQLAIDLKDKTQMGNSYIELGHDYIRMSDLGKASDAIFKASCLFKETNNLKGYGIAFNLLGDLYLSHKKYIQAVQYFRKSIDIHVELKDSVQISNDYNNLGETYRLKGVFDSALFYFREAEHLFRSQKYALGIAYSLGNIGLVYVSLGKEQTAVKKLEEATSILKQNDDMYPISVFNIEMAKASYEKGNHTSSLVFARKGYEIAASEGLLEQLRDASFVLHKIFLLQKSPDSSITYLNQHYSFKDSIINGETVQKLNDLQSELEISKMKDQVDQITVKSKRNFTGLVTLCVIVFLIVLFSFYLWILNKKMKNANEKLEEQSRLLQHQKHLIGENLKEKETLLKEIHHRVKNNLQIISSLLNLQSNTLIDEQVIEIFQKGQSRIQSIALIHQKLYQNEKITVIDIQEYTEQLALKLIDFLAREDLKILTHVKAKNILLDIDTAVPIGLMINELITNSIKYAFVEGGENRITIEMAEQEKHHYKLHYSDSGKGLPEGFNLECSSTLGSKLLSILTRQLGGEILYYNENGTNFIITFYDLVKVKETDNHGKH